MLLYPSGIELADADPAGKIGFNIRLFGNFQC